MSDLDCSLAVRQCLLMPEKMGVHIYVCEVTNSPTERKVGSLEH